MDTRRAPNAARTAATVYTLPSPPTQNVMLRWQSILVERGLLKILAHDGLYAVLYAVACEPSSWYCSAANSQLTMFQKASRYFGRALR